MTSPALIKKTDLRRMASIAKSENVAVWIEIDGRRIGVSPDHPPRPDEKSLGRKKEIDL